MINEKLKAAWAKTITERDELKAEIVTVPVIVRKLTPDQEFEVMLTENIQRQDLDPIEEAVAFKAAVDRGWKQEQLAVKLGISQAQVANRLRLLKLPGEVQELISREILSAGHGLALVKVATVMPELAQQMAGELQENDIPVARAAEVIDHKIASIGKPLHSGAAYDEPEFNHKDICINSKCLYRVHGKQRWDKKEHAYCIKPECWEKHQTAAKEAKRQQKIEEMRAQAAAAGEDPDRVKLPSLRDMPFDTYEKFSSYSAFKLEDCKPCEKIADALDHSDEAVKICTDVACWKKKKRAKTIAEGKETRAKRRSFEDTKLDKIAQVMETGVTREELIFIAARAIQNPGTSAEWQDHKVKPEILKTFGLPDFLAWWDKEKTPAVIARLHEMDDLQLGKLIFFCQFRGIAEDDNLYQLTLGAAAGDGEEAATVG